MLAASPPPGLPPAQPLSDEGAGDTRARCADAVALSRRRLLTGLAGRELGDARRGRVGPAIESARAAARVRRAGPPGRRPRRARSSGAPCRRHAIGVLHARASDSVARFARARCATSELPERAIRERTGGRCGYAGWSAERVIASRAEDAERLDLADLSARLLPVRKPTPPAVARRGRAGRAGRAVDRRPARLAGGLRSDIDVQTARGVRRRSRHGSLGVVTRARGGGEARKARARGARVVRRSRSERGVHERALNLPLHRNEAIVRVEGGPVLLATPGEVVADGVRVAAPQNTLAIGGEVLAGRGSKCSRGARRVRGGGFLEEDAAPPHADAASATRNRECENPRWEARARFAFKWAPSSGSRRSTRKPWPASHRHVMTLGTIDCSSPKRATRRLRSAAGHPLCSRRHRRLGLITDGTFGAALLPPRPRPIAGVVFRETLRRLRKACEAAQLGRSFRREP